MCVISKFAHQTPDDILKSLMQRRLGDGYPNGPHIKPAHLPPEVSESLARACLADPGTDIRPLTPANELRFRSEREWTGPAEDVTGTLSAHRQTERPDPSFPALTLRLRAADRLGLGAHMPIPHCCKCRKVVEGQRPSRSVASRQFWCLQAILVLVDRFGTGGQVWY